MNEKQQLIREYFDNGGKDYTITQLENRSVRFITDLIEAEQSRDMPQETLIAQYNEIDVPDKTYTPEQLKEFSSFDIMQLIQKERLYEKSLRLEKVFPVTNIYRESDDKVESDLAKFHQFSVNDNSEESDRINQENLKIEYENRLRQDIGLSEKPLLPTHEQLLICLELDGNKINKTCNEFLDKFKDDKYQKDKIKRKLSEISAIREQESRREAREARFLQDITQEYSRLKKVPQKLKKDGDIYVVSDEFKKWASDLQALNEKLDKQIRINQSKESDPNMNVTFDKRSSLYQIASNVKELLKNE